MKSKSAGRPHSPVAPESLPEQSAARPNDLSIVALGSSAGGIEAFAELMSALPADTGMAFVLVQHLDPEHHSLLAELFSKKTSMSVKEVANGMEVEPNHVYVIPPNTTMSISGRTLTLAPRGEVRGIHMSIDHFMRALAEQHGNHAIGVVLSGSGTDGTIGLAEIQAHGGVTFAQDEASAKYDSMPRSAVAAGCVDYILPPKSIAHELARIARHPYLSRDHTPETVLLAPSENSGLDLVFELMRKSSGVDFTHYRQTTILRRIQRRMVVHKIDRIDDYVKFVRADPAEIKSLYQDLLINVTSFFRNPQVFDALKVIVFPHIFKYHSPDLNIRVWTPGCASGEETYSVAIALLEFLGERASQTHIQFFGTDVGENSIAKARSGLYPDNILGDVSHERLRRFFAKVEGGYRISKIIRDMCIFAQHNVINDPPFSHMDLICCRNLLIYLEPFLQNKVVSLFHYATRPGGYLLLGASEGVAGATALFSTEDRAHKIFRKRTTTARQPVTFSLSHSAGRPDYAAVRIPAKQPDSGWNYLEAQKEFDRRLLSLYSPATVFINEDLEIIHTRGSVSRYLKLAPGRASLSILKMAREGLHLDLRNAIAKAKKDDVTVRKQNIQIKSGDGESASRPGGIRHVTFEVAPIHMPNLREIYFMVVFAETPAVPRPSSRRRSRAARDSDAASSRITNLEEELGANKEYLQSVIEAQEATNEELQSANEEILSSNEELQSTNEELETAKEELQSTNEELSTVNDELRNRNAEISQINSDLTNLFASIDIAVVTIGRDLSIRRFTPHAQKYLGLIPTDIGRPLLNINPVIEIPDFQALVLQVMASLRPVERELQDREGARLLLRILPYRTSDNKIDGAVITIVDFLAPADNGPP